MIQLTFITGNAAKAEQLGRHLDYPVSHRKLDLLEIQSLDLREIIEHKAKEAYKEVGGMVLVEDTSLIFNALGRLPGPLIKWFLDELDNAGLCTLLDGYEDRTALAACMFGLYDGETLRVFEGSIEGSIVPTPKGGHGFGWDPIFIPKGHTKTWGEMDTEEQKETSMRRIALKKLETHLRTLQ
jgi:non-canonical purine NTP pyrophosphatase (RdgB/HAM1 family)